jgi:uncharacterized repeat protein (TIGR01451 family)
LRHRLCILAVSILSLTVVESAAAQPAPVTLTFDHAVLSTPATPDTVIVSPATPVTMTAQYDASTGDFTVTPASFSLPPSTFTSPVPGSIQIVLGSPASGHFDASTGELTMTADYVADITVTGVGSCTIDSGVQTYSTELSSVYPGTRFPATTNGLFTGPGAISGGWSTLPAGTGSACSLINSAVDGPGGFWFSKGIAPPASKAPAALSLSSTPAKVTLAAGKSVMFTVAVKNTGGTAASNVMVCIAAPKPLSVHGPKCRSLGSFAAGTSIKAKFTLKTSSSAHGSYTIRFTATGKGVPVARHSSTVKIKKGKKLPRARLQSFTSLQRASRTCKRAVAGHDETRCDAPLTGLCCRSGHHRKSLRVRASRAVGYAPGGTASPRGGEPGHCDRPRSGASGAYSLGSRLPDSDCIVVARVLEAVGDPWRADRCRRPAVKERKAGDPYYRARNRMQWANDLCIRGDRDAGAAKMSEAVQGLRLQTVDAWIVRSEIYRPPGWVANRAAKLRDKRETNIDTFHTEIPNEVVSPRARRRVSTGLRIVEQRYGSGRRRSQLDAVSIACRPRAQL